MWSWYSQSGENLWFKICSFAITRLMSYEYSYIRMLLLYINDIIIFHTMGYFSRTINNKLVNLKLDMLETHTHTHTGIFSSWSYWPVILLFTTLQESQACFKPPNMFSRQLQCQGGSYNPAASRMIKYSPKDRVKYVVVWMRSSQHSFSPGWWTSRQYLLRHAREAPAPHSSLWNRARRLIVTNKCVSVLPLLCRVAVKIGVCVLRLCRHVQPHLRRVGLLTRTRAA